MDNWVARQHILLQVAQAHQHQSDSHLLVEYDSRITEYTVHSYVLFTPPVGRGNKLLPKHRGPFQVMDKMDSIYTIDDPSCWEPYKALMHLDKLHDYLRANTMKPLIPREHK